jgi:hypothetical protein
MRSLFALAGSAWDSTRVSVPYMLLVVDNGTGADEAVPGVSGGAEGRPGPVMFTLGVDGELFAIRRGHDGGTNYAWITGPNGDYGFGSSASPDQSEREHRASIQTFLHMIDPATGYIADN